MGSWLKLDLIHVDEKTGKCHQAVDAATDIGQHHQHVGTVISCGQRAFDGIDLTADAFDAGKPASSFRCQESSSFLLAYPRGVCYKN